MLFKIYYGEISEEWNQNWEQKRKEKEEGDPFEVLKETYDIHCHDWMEFLHWAQSHLNDQINVDWGSSAWRCTGEDLHQLKRELKGTGIQRFKSIQPEKEYGVVFIEMS